MRLIRLKLCLIALLFTIRGAAAWADDVFFSEPFLDSKHPATMFELAIPSEGSRMPGHIYVANGPGPHPTVVLLHGLPGNEKNLDLAQALRRVGFNVLFFNFRGAWGAEGTYKLSQLDDDVLAAISFVRDETNAQQYRIDPSRLTLIGHSIGGFAALAAGSKTDDVICVGALAPTNLGLDKRDLERGGAVIEDFAAYADQLRLANGTRPLLRRGSKERRCLCLWVTRMPGCRTRTTCYLTCYPA